MFSRAQNRLIEEMGGINAANDARSLAVLLVADGRPDLIETYHVDRPAADDPWLVRAAVVLAEEYARGVPS